MDRYSYDRGLSTRLLPLAFHSLASSLRAR
jgi:hypothetical protein